MQMSTISVDEVAIRVTTTAVAVLVWRHQSQKRLVIAVVCHCTTFSFDCIKQPNILLTIFHTKIL